MKNLRNKAIILVLLAGTGLAIRLSYQRGFHDSNVENSKAWGALVESGWLDGNTNRIDRFARQLDGKQVEYIAKDYRDHYQKFSDEMNRIPVGANARSLLEQHLLTHMKPDEFEEVLKEYLKPTASIEKSRVRLNLDFAQLGSNRSIIQR